jgi:hypothetical protein
MNLRSLMTWVFLCGALGAAALGTISIMKLRMEADVIGSRIVRLERSIADTKKDLDNLKRQRDQSLDTLQLQSRIGDALKPPVPEQVVWISRAVLAPVSVAPLSSNISPRLTPREIAYRPLTGQGAGTAR